MPRMASASTLRLLLVSALALSCGCQRLSDLSNSEGEPLAKAFVRPLTLGDHFPNDAEASVVGEASAPVRRGSAPFQKLVRCDACPFVFKDEEHDRSDRVMTPRLRRTLLRLGRLVQDSWPGIKLRVTDAWDEEREHRSTSLHYEGRAADLTTSDQDPGKLGALGALAIRAGCDWVFYENARHVHVSVKR